MFSSTKQLVFWYCISWLEVNDTQNDIKPSVLIHIILHRPSIGWFADETLPPRRMDPSDPSSLQALPSWARTHRKRIAPSSSKSHGQSPSAPQGPGDNEINGLPRRLAWHEKSCRKKSLSTSCPMSKGMSQHTYYENVCETL